MGVTGTVVLALVAGILSCASAQSDASKLESLCVKNGGPTAWADFQISAQNAANCASSMADAVMEEYYNTRGDISAALGVYCRRVETIINCFENFIESFKPCIDPGDELLFNVTVGTIAPTLQFACANTKLIKDAIESTDRQCFMSKDVALKTCTRNVMTNINTTSPEYLPLPVTGINPHEIQPQLEPGLGSQLCSNILAAEQCSVEVLEECEDKIFSTVLDSIHKYVNNYVPCQNLPKSPKS